MKVSAKTVRYIKLGAGGRWENSLDRAELHFGYGSVTHELALEGNRAKIIEHLIALGRSPQAAARDAQEVADFYDLDETCLWITFARDHLWWTLAEPKVTWLKPDPTRPGRALQESHQQVAQHRHQRDAANNKLAQHQADQGRKLSEDDLRRQSAGLSATAHQWYRGADRRKSQPNPDRAARGDDRGPAAAALGRFRKPR
ncbi:hypothetical protein JQ596_11450 [Bradyrhizobium manausense]|uniref:hypothetical protein n=1 Tax=Bradyrhizobium manausense TaxID=989370 RepID=UPI001BAB8187|nr:hypothetical protein [Bradyrhizobium manausense]MBR0826156.1 hypothetical protein [Bradyrhizobium manausense]